jgi:predicted dienelactone hydrolase
MSMRHSSLIAAFIVLAAGGLAVAYDPLATQGSAVTTVDLVVQDAARNRKIPALVYLPAVHQAQPVVLFSHGLGGSRHGSAYLGKHWAARGYVAVFVQHPGSDISFWENLPPSQRVAAFRQAASAENFFLRVMDIPAVLDQLAQWQADPKHELRGRLDLERVGMSGHSFGAVTTQAVAGQNYGRLGQRFIDPRIDAAIPMSPSLPARLSPTQSFGRVKLPWLLMTGTKDGSMIRPEQTPASRMAVYPALPADGSKYELVLHNAEHSAFTERPLPGETEPRNPNHHRAILALSTAFWDAYLRGEADARAWLDAAGKDGPRHLLEAKDRWQRK